MGIEGYQNVHQDGYQRPYGMPSRSANEEPENPKLPKRQREEEKRPSSKWWGHQIPYYVDSEHGVKVPPRRVQTKRKVKPNQPQSCQLTDLPFPLPLDSGPSRFNPGWPL